MSKKYAKELEDIKEKLIELEKKINSLWEYVKIRDNIIKK